MSSSEPIPTAILLTVAGVLVLASVLFSRTMARRGLPVVLVFLVIGMLAGSEGIGGIAFEDYRLALRIGTLGLVLILFDGGLNTTLDVVKRQLAPAAILATVGVALTAGLLAVAARVLGLAWPEALLLGAVVSSTDAAAVFAILRNSGIQLRHRVGATLELESGLNDPLALILTLGLTEAMVSGEPISAWLIAKALLQLVIGGVLGIFLGLGARKLMWRPMLSGGLYPVLTVAVSFVAFGVPTLLGGSGLLAVYMAGIVLGNGPLPYRSGVLRVHDFAAWLSQIVIFVALGLLVFPSRLVAVLGSGLAVAAALALFARPVSVVLCLLPFRFRVREVAFMSWVGLRGAVPIVLAIIPILAGAAGAHRVFDLVFFVVVVSALVQGGSVSWLTRRLDLKAHSAPTPPAVLEITTSQPLAGELLSFYLQPSSAVTGARIADVPFPEGSSVLLVVRGPEVIAARGSTELRAGDHVHVYCRTEDRALIQLLFGAPQD